MSNVTSVIAGSFPDWDYVYINGDKSPGKAIIQRPNSPRGWEERKGFGLTGATLVPTGDPLAEFSIRFEFWDPVQLVGTGQGDADGWYNFAAKYFDKGVCYFPPGSRTPRALGIAHPILAAAPLRIMQVVVTNATGLEKTDDGLWSCEVFFKQYRKPIPAKPAPQAAIPPAAAAAPTALDAADIEMQSKLDTFNSLI